MAWRILCITGWLGLLATASPADGSEAPPAAVEALFASMSHGPGAAVLVARDGKVLLSKGYGLADVAGVVPIRPETRFNIASISKPFTALAILKLREEGKVRLEDALAVYLPDLPSARRFTLRQLLSHTSGLPDFVGFDQAMSGPLDFEPGDRLNYSNIGYSALGRVIEVASGRSYEDYVRRAILAPLNLTATHVDHGSGSGRATGYRLDEAGGFVPVAPQDRSADPAAGGLVSNVEDLFRLDQALYGSGLLPSAALDEAFAPVRLTDGHLGHYGFGWMVGHFRGLREIAHGGDIDGFNGFLARYPGERFTVIVLANYPMASAGAFPTAADLAHHIVESYLGDRLEAEKSLSRRGSRPSRDLCGAVQAPGAASSRRRHGRGPHHSGGGWPTHRERPERPIGGARGGIRQRLCLDRRPDHAHLRTRRAGTSRRTHREPCRIAGVPGDPYRALGSGLVAAWGGRS